MLDVARPGLLRWVHIGDLHMTTDQETNHRDLLEIIGAINANLAGHIDFCVLPGDNADDGTEQQYRTVREALSGLNVPVHILPGDHDRKRAPSLSEAPGQCT
jgi:3',5'-cyclic AMP phosphodiesterase CpdA